MKPKDPRDNRDDRLEPEGRASGGDSGPTGTQDPTASLRTGEGTPQGSIGPYRLLQPLGEGGMGQVWEAEQIRPVRRRVALKIIKAGMDSRKVVGRFEAERQALALMDHPAIAKVFDAGTTPAGRPFFVMELVRGEPIDRFCDRHRLTTRERLELFLQVCDGIEHAHQKGIIHRDLKPSNMLVALRGEVPEPKIIDFGVAKATQHRLTEATMVTELGTLIGTPAYMSPEQAELTGLDVDTRTDIYALGVILYQLLVGVLPFDLRQAGFDEIRRVIREEEPTRPSTRLGTLGDHSTAAARCRRVDLPALRRQLRGDLDWITLKALEKDRRRRYGSATELAADVRRHLGDEPVLAGPPSTIYRARKFVRRHRLGVAAASLVVATMLSGLGAATWGLLRARQAEVRARQEAATAQRVTGLLTNMFESSTPRSSQGNDITVREVLDRAARRLREELQDEPEVRARMLATVGHVYSDIGLKDKAEPLLEEARNDLGTILGEEAPETLNARRRLAWVRASQGRLDDAAAMMFAVLEAERRQRGEDATVTLGVSRDLGNIYRRQGRYAEAETLLAATLERQRRVLGEANIGTVNTMLALSGVYQAQGRLDEARELRAEAYDVAKREWGDDGLETLAAQRSLARSLKDLGSHEEAEHLVLDSLERHRRVFGEDHANTRHVVWLLQALYKDLGRHDKAERLLLDSLERMQRIYGESNTETLNAIHSLARFYYEQKRLPEAEKYRTMLLEGRRRALGPEHHETIRAMDWLAFIKYRRDKLSEAEPLAREALEMGLRALGEEHPATRSAMRNLATILSSQGNYGDAERMYEELLQINRRALGDDHPAVLMVMKNLAVIYSKHGRKDEAVPLYEKVLEVERRDRGEEHANTLRAMGNLAAAYSGVGRVDEAETMLRQALDTKRRMVSGGDLVTIYMLRNLAVLHVNSGRFREAVPVAEEAVEMARRILGQNSSDTAGAEVGLAAIYSHVGRADEAERLCIAALEVLVETVGDEDIDTLDAMRVLADTRVVQGRFGEAERLFDQVIGAQSEVLGTEHPSLMDTLYSRALLAAARQEWQEALSYLRQAVDGGWAERRIYSEPSLAPLRGDAAFEAIVAAVRERVGERDSRPES